MSEDSLLIEPHGSALWLIINRPERRNAINEDVLARLSQAMTSAANEPSVRALVITGVGEKAFCSGADLSAGAPGFNQGIDTPTTSFGRFARAARNFPKPLVARINGDCLAGGMGLLALCDLAIAVDHARFGLPEARLGLFPMQVSVWLRRLIAPRHLRALALTGAMISATKAQDIGLINEIMPTGGLDAAIEALCAQLAAMSPQALQRGKFALNAMEDMNFEAALAFAEAQITLAAQTADAREGIAAFAGRRVPGWASG